MTNDELAARIVVLEALAVAALGVAIRFGQVPLPAEYVVSILDSVKGIVRFRLAGDFDEKLSPAGQVEASRYLEYVLSEFSESVISPRKRDGGPKTDGDKG
jgi:hypothetical protein